MKLLHIFIVLFLFAFIACAEAQEGFYFETGFSVHNEQLDAPEFKGSNPLGNIGLGYTIDVDSYYIDVYFKHTSSIPDYEEGYGLNQVGIQVRRYL